MACTTTLPVVLFNDACQTVELGQVFKIFMTRATSADVLADVTDLDEWALRIDQDAVVPGSGAAPIRELSGIGGWAEGEVTDIEIPLDQIFSTTGNKVLTFRVYDLTSANYAAFITLRDAGTTQQKIWTLQGTTIIGGDAGINGSMRADLVVPEGRTELQYGVVTFTTKNSLNSAVASPHPVL